MIFVYFWRKSVGAAILNIKISGNFVLFTTVLCTLKEGKQDTSHIFHLKREAMKLVF
jgi:hypothetical protein